MPLFSSKFSPKKTPLRKAPISLSNTDLSPQRLEKELGPEVGPIRICLGDMQAVFENGVWIPGENINFLFYKKKTFQTLRLKVSFYQFNNKSTNYRIGRDRRYV